MILRVNETELNTVSIDLIENNKIGFLVSGKQKTAFDNLKIKSNIKTEYIYYDEFNDNKNDWSLQDDESALLEIKDGKYIFEYKKENDSWISFNNSKISPYKNFTLTTKVKHLGGKENYSYGLMWGLDSDNSYFFGISQSGAYLYGKYIDGKWKTISRWTTSSYISKGSNIIGVKKVGNKLNLIINSAVVKTVPFEFFEGDNIGFSVDDKQKVEFEYIKLVQ